LEITVQITALLPKVYGETNEQDMYLSNDGLKDLDEIEYIVGSRSCTRHYWGEPE